MRLQHGTSWNMTTWKVNFLCQKSSEFFRFFFHLEISIYKHIFCIRRLLITSILEKFYFWNDAQFLTTRHCVNLQNRTISFEDIDFRPEIFLFLYPSLENSTTHITIQATMQQNTNFQVETAAWDLVKHDYLKIMEGDNRISENNLNSLFCIFNRFCDPHTVCWEQIWMISFWNFRKFFT